jgi:hypothetical protein
VIVSIDELHMGDLLRVIHLGQYALSRDYVYAHADQLGAIRLGSGPRALALAGEFHRWGLVSRRELVRAAAWQLVFTRYGASPAQAELMTRRGLEPGSYANSCGADKSADRGGEP